MSKVLKQFEDLLFRKNAFSKLFTKQTPGKRILPPQAGNNDSTYQLRLDAGESLDGKKNIYLQVNSQAKNEALKKWVRQNGSHANLAVTVIDENTPPEKQEQVSKNAWDDLEDQAKANLK
jgi:hypothetical protein